jgi:hypothetical protein
VGVVELTAREWRGFRREEFPRESWAIEGRVLRARGAGERVDLVTRRRFRDFDLSFDWRLPPGGNSGVLYRVSEEAEESWHSGPEMQLLDDLAHPEGRERLTSCGALYGLLAPRRIALPATEAFFKARLRVQGTRAEHWLSQHLVLAYDLDDPALKERIAGSKFAAYPRFAAEPEGHIVLQHHGTDAWFRNLHLEVLGD